VKKSQDHFELLIFGCEKILIIHLKATKKYKLKLIKYNFLNYSNSKEFLAAGAYYLLIMLEKF
jgi:hypothetical protein